VDYNVYPVPSVTMTAQPLTTRNGTSLGPLGLASYPGQEPACVPAAFHGGIPLFFFYDASQRYFLTALRNLLSTDRDAVFVASGTSEREPQAIADDLQRTLTLLDIDQIDAFLLEYVSPEDDPATIFGPCGGLSSLYELKQRGLIRHVGASAHDRTLAVRLIEDGRCDILMHRYNMAHRKAETTVFPAALQHDVAVWTFTATRWGSLLQGHPQWPGEPPAALDCYRFCLAQPAVQTVLMAPLRVTELTQDLQLLSSPPMSAEEIQRWQMYGDLIYGDGQGRFETQWL
jgi:aryl-alcohol dehydrogenase-like predicted oxidoreductase